MKRSSEELGLAEVVAKYPEVPRLVALKIDVQRRGVHYTDRALDAVDERVHQTGGTHIFGTRDGRLTSRPESLLLRDGTSVITTPTPLELGPYVVDLTDEGPALLDDGEPVEEVDYWPKPAYYDKKTRAGIPMSHVVSSRPQRLYIMASRYCHFWSHGEGCRFCDIVSNLKRQREEMGLPARVSPADVAETVGEALKEPGRFSAVCITSGSDFRGETAFDAEVDYYIEILRAVGENFGAGKFPSQLIATAFTEDQLVRLYEQTGLLTYTADIEVLDEAMFDWICPGKARWVGYREWKRRLVRAVDVFGRGFVDTCIVGGVEMARPRGFSTEEQALKTVLAEAEELASQGVSTVYTVWVSRPGSAFAGQRSPSLEYYVRLAMGLHGLRVKYGLDIDFDDFRRCGNHPDTDLSRLLRREGRRAGASAV